MSKKKRVAWDERNLEENEEYRRLHPVTMHISEPKTPYAHAMPEEEGNFTDIVASTNACEDEESINTTWDPEVNALARRLKDERPEKQDVVVAPLGPRGRPMLSPEVVTGALAEKQRAKEFVRMRKAIYADEGTKFKELLGSSCKDEDDE